MAKRILAIMVIIMVVFTGSIGVKAEQGSDENRVYVEELTAEQAEAIDNYVSSVKIMVDPLLNTRYDTLPTGYWNISVAGPYEFFFDVMQYYTYSNYYFTPSASGSLYMRATSFDSEGEQIKIKLYKVNDTYPVYTWTGNPENIYGLAFNGLNQGNLYYFKFEAYESPYVTGWGYICHNYNDV